MKNILWLFAAVIIAPIFFSCRSSYGALPSPWQDSDIGSVGLAGSASVSNDVFSVSGSGADIFGNADAFHYVYQTLNGDGEVRARVASIQNTDPWAKIGVMMRETLASNSKHAMAVVTRSSGVICRSRLTTGGTTAGADSTGAAPYWVRLIRAGNIFSAAKSTDGVTWTALGSSTITMSSTIYVGLAVTAHNNGVLNTSTFDNVTVQATTQPVVYPTVSLTAPAAGTIDYTGAVTVNLAATASISSGSIAKVQFYAGATLLGESTTSPYTYAWTGVDIGNYVLKATAISAAGNGTDSATVAIAVKHLSSPWQNADVGSVGPMGIGSESGGTFTVKGSGADIFGTADAFQYVYQPLSGDGEIIAHAVSVQNTDAFAKSGVMIRETLAANSKNASIFVTPANGIVYRSRLTTGGSASGVNSSGAAPYWIRLVRSGSTFSSYKSTDGAAWTLITTDTVSMTSNVYVGLVVCSHNAAVLGTSVFDHVSVASAAQLPVVAITSPTAGASLTGLATVSLAADASVAEGALAKVEFRSGNVLLGEAATAPYTLSWPNVAVGSYTVTARAITTDGFITTSAPVTFSVHHPGAGGDGLSGTYFDNNDLSAAKLNRVDATVNFNWATTPDVTIAPETYSVRWLGRVQPYYSETYTFYTIADAGVRVWINRQLLIDNWDNAVATETSGSIALTAGQTYDVKIEFYNNAAAGKLELRWSSTSTPKEIIPQSQLFSTGGDMLVGTGDGLTGTYFNALDLSTATVLTRVDQTVNFNWSNTSPGAGVNANNFSARWTGQVQAQYNETYTITFKTGNGARLWFDNQLAIDHWTTIGSMAEYSFDVALVAGSKHDIVIECCESIYSAIGRLSWSSPTTVKAAIPQSQLYTTGNTTVPAFGSGTGLFASYFNSMNLSGGLAPNFNTPVLTRIEPAVNFDWSYGSPDASINHDSFSARWIGQVEPQYTETYTFYVICDCGARLWVNNQLLVDAWTERDSAATFSGTIDLKAGEKVGIKLEYFEHLGQASAKLQWSSASRAKITVPQNQLSSETGFAVVIPAASVVSPAFFEGLAWPLGGVPAGMSANGVAGTFISDNNWYVNVPLNTDGAPTAITVTDTGTAATKTVNATWWPLDLAGSNASEHNIVIRKGDSLLLTANGAGEVLTLDADGDNIDDFTGVPGQKFPYRYNTAGTFTAEAKIDGVSAGTLVVTVVDADLIGPIACEIGYQREKVVSNSPANANLSFVTNDPVLLNVMPQQPAIAGTPSLLLKPLKAGKPILVARLFADGPIIATQPIDAYTLIHDAGMVMSVDPDGFGHTKFYIKMSPRIADLTITIAFFVHPTTIAGQSTYTFSSNELDGDGEWEMDVILDPGPPLTCHKVLVFQSN